MCALYHLLNNSNNCNWGRRLLQFKHVRYFIDNERINGFTMDAEKESLKFIKANRTNNMNGVTFRKLSSGEKKKVVKTAIQRCQ